MSARKLETGWVFGPEAADIMGCHYRTVMKIAVLGNVRIQVTPAQQLTYNRDDCERVARERASVERIDGRRRRSQPVS